MPRVLFTPFDLDEAKSIILRAWSSSQRERAVLRVRRKLPPGIGPATEHPQASARVIVSWGRNETVDRSNVPPVRGAGPFRYRRTPTISARSGSALLIDFD